MVWVEKVNAWVHRGVLDTTQVHAISYAFQTNAHKIGFNGEMMGVEWEIRTHPIPEDSDAVVPQKWEMQIWVARFKPLTTRTRERVNLAMYWITSDDPTVIQDVSMTPMARLDDPDRVVPGFCSDEWAEGVSEEKEEEKRWPCKQCGLEASEVLKCDECGYTD